MSAQKITTVGFLSEFLARHKKMPDRPFCWVLGAGASFQSGIPTGGTLAMQWLKELHEMEDFSKLPIEKWATAENLGIRKFDFQKAANFYPFIYQRRFRDFREQGYAFLEDAMQKAEPSYGYSVLAQIMSGTQHKVAVTTNFDDLIADAISTYTHDYPLVCGHESLTGFIRPNLKRPVVAKIHRDLLLNPKSEPEEIEKLSAEWEVALQTIFDNNTPIVIGYGGNDGSLMGFLKKIPRIKGGIFWCYREGREPNSKIHEIVDYHHGKFVPIFGFDELMLQLSEKLPELPSPITELQTTHDKRKAELLKQFAELNKRINQPGKNEAAEAMLKQIRSAASFARERFGLENTPTGWQLKAIAEPDRTKVENICREGVKNFPNNADLISQLASHLHTYCKNYDEAEQLYRKAIELDSGNAFYIGELAYFLETVRKNSAEAELLWRKADELDPNPTRPLHLLGFFSATMQKDYNGALEFLRKASSNAPVDGSVFAKLAKQVEDSWKNPEVASLFYQKAITSNPNDENIKKEYARFQKEHPEFSK